MRDWIVVPPNIKDYTTLINAEFYKRTEERNCPLDARHFVRSRYADLNVALTGLRNDKIVPGLTFTLIRADLADALNASKLTGFEIEPVVIGDWEPEKDQKIFYLRFAGPPAKRPPAVVPETANRCAFCGYEPLVCPVCGFWKFGCARCDMSMFCPADQHKGQRDPRIKIIPRRDDDWIIELNRWDGSDFFGSPGAAFVTRRALDMLLSVHAGPLVAIPVPVDVSNAPAESLERLKQAKSRS